MKRKIYVVGGDYRYANWMEGEIVNHLKDADLVVFTGGADVNPYLYVKECHPATMFNARRDEYEIDMFQQCRKYDKKVIGICRGAQFLCVMAGGSLVQHMYHPPTHNMETKHGRIRVTSLHHQRQYPYNNKHINWELIGWCNGLAPYSEGESPQDDLRGTPEVEIASYSDINALAIQSHPEMAYYPEMASSSMWPWEESYIKYCRDILNVHMESKVKVLV